MWKTTHCASWLQERYEETDTSSEMFLSDIYKEYQGEGGTLKSNSVGKYLGRLFKKCKCIRKFNSITYKDETVYLGLCKKTPSSSKLTGSISDIKQWICSPFFVSYDNEEEIHISLITDEIVNDNPIIKRVVFKANNTWELSIGQKTIRLDECNIANSFIPTKECVHNICTLACKVRLCSGKQKENIEAINLKKHVTEYLGVEKTQIFRSFKCSRALPFLNIGESCHFCSKFRRYPSQTTLNPPKKSKNKFEVPLQSVSGNVLPVHKDTSYIKNEDNLDEFDNVVLKESNSDDMKKILEEVLPQASGEMLDMLVDQKKFLAKNPNGRRWDPKTISLCLSLWCRSQKNYTLLQDSKVLILPSRETLRVHKCSVEQRAGFNKEVMKWMADSAKEYKSEDGMCGGIAIDEMSIQEDLCMIHSNGEVKLIGFVDMGEEADYLEKMCSGKSEKKLATHVLQFLYIGLNGFRFPFACFPVIQTKAGNLHFLFWKAVQYLNTYGFKVCFVSMDGAQTNRDFIKMFFNESSPEAENFSVRNIWFPEHPPIIFIMDYSHVIKRIRNNILKSGKDCKRHLTYHNQILWEHWINAFKWDRDTNSFPIHHKLTNDHLFLTQESKMRNKLAEDVLDKEMLHLMQSFKTFLGETGDVLDDTINLLKATSTMVSVFRDKRPITDTEDIRIEQLQEALSWFGDWENFVVHRKDVPSGKKEKMLISYQTREDIRSCLTGFTQLCKNMLQTSRCSLVPARINSDVIENIFCQQRGIINGNNTNPTFYQFAKNINSVIIGQSVISKSSNTGSGKFNPVTILSSQKSRKETVSPSTSADPLDN